MIRHLLLFCFVISFLAPAQGQDKFWVFLTDKDGVEFDPYAYFDEKAIERREKHGLPLDHYTDRPLRADYVANIGTLCDSIKMQSRWFNALVCFGDADDRAEISALDFVKEVRLVEGVPNTAEWSATKPLVHPNLERPDLDLLKAQVERFNPTAFRDQKLDGTGVRVAIFDAGFPKVDVSSAFSHIRARGGIKGTYDFVKKKDFVYSYNSHGTAVMSCIGGYIENQPSGLATGAEFLLARTETWTEKMREEENWLAAAEWADKNGADIINSSLGYTYHRYFPYDMDGRKSLVARAANMAAGKGILVVNAAGNDGDGDWRTIGTPADADSVLAVGGIRPHTGIHTDFSSFGPTSDLRMKPNVTAFGHVIAEGKHGWHETAGTSFSSPLTAGFAACALQSNPEWTAMELFAAIEQAGDLYPYYDYAHGYGVPQADRLLGNAEKKEQAFAVESKAGHFYFVLTDSSAIGDRHALKGWGGVPSEISAYTEWPNYVFWHLEHPDGYVQEYYLVYPHSYRFLLVNKSKWFGYKLRVFYRGVIFEKEIE